MRSLIKKFYKWSKPSDGRGFHVFGELTHTAETSIANSVAEKEIEHGTLHWPVPPAENLLRSNTTLTY